MNFFFLKKQFPGLCWHSQIVFYFLVHRRDDDLKLYRQKEIITSIFGNHTGLFLLFIVSASFNLCLVSLCALIFYAVGNIVIAKITHRNTLWSKRVLQRSLVFEQMTCRGHMTIS